MFAPHGATSIKRAVILPVPWSAPSMKTNAKPITRRDTCVPLGKTPVGQKAEEHESQIGAVTNARLVERTTLSKRLLYCPAATYVSFGGLPIRSSTPCLTGPF